MGNGGRFVISYPNEDLINLVKKIMKLLYLKNIFFPGKYQPEMDMSVHWHKRKIKLKVLLKKIIHLPVVLTIKHIVYGIK